MMCSCTRSSGPSFNGAGFQSAAGRTDGGARQYRSSRSACAASGGTASRGSAGCRRARCAQLPWVVRVSVRGHGAQIDGLCGFPRAHEIPDPVDIHLHACGTPGKAGAARRVSSLAASPGHRQYSMPTTAASSRRSRRGARRAWMRTSLRSNGRGRDWGSHPLPRKRPQPLDRGADLVVGEVECRRSLRTFRDQRAICASPKRMARHFMASFAGKQSVPDCAYLIFRWGANRAGRPQSSTNLRQTHMRH